MLRNYLTVGLRSLFKNRAYAVINIFGLAIGMAACLLILLFVRYEVSFDRWIPGVADSYQIQTFYDGADGGQPQQMQMASYVTGPMLAKDFPEVEHQVYMLSSNPVIKQGDTATATQNYHFVNGNFLDVVHLPLVRGNAAAFSAMNSAIMSHSEAIARFGTDDVIGRTLSLIARGETHDYRIVAVLRDLPKNSSLRIDALVHIDFPAFFATQPQFLTCWGCQSGWVYVRLRPGTDPASIAARLPAWEKRNIPDTNTGEVHFNQGDHTDWHLTNLAAIHLGKAQGTSQTPGDDIRSLTTFSVIALLILGMAVVNFVNLATARANQRAREVALRKVLGASRRQLIAQFIGESILVATIAMLIALALAELLLPVLANFLDADLRLHYFGSGGVLLPILVLMLLVGTLGGLYPAVFLSRFQPAAVLRANRSAAETPGTGRLRTLLVIGQFAVSIGLIICTAVIYAQTVYARTVDPGFKRDHILQVDNLARYQLVNTSEQIAERVRHVPGVDAVGRTNIGVDTHDHDDTGVLIAGNPNAVDLGTYAVDVGFKDAMGMRVLAGRWFDDARPADDSSRAFPLDPASERALVARGANIVVSLSAAHALGFKQPADAIGKQVRGGLVDSEYGLLTSNIIGVVNDARYRSVRDPIEPIMFNFARNNLDTMIVRYHGDPEAVRAGVERVWTGFTREVPFEAKFSEEIVGQLYRAEEARAKTFAGFAFLSVIVGCLGLFGLASFTAERRTKEIGIRKVLGARTRDIVRLLVWQFSRPVLVANLIAWPVSWWVMKDWLDRFDARIALGPVPFLFAGGLALVIAILTIGSHAFRVARANPIHALRYE